MIPLGAPLAPPQRMEAGAACTAMSVRATRELAQVGLPLPAHILVPDLGVHRGRPEPVALVVAGELELVRDFLSSADVV
eukprot:1805648-Prorocentrum_lima.AAC.1